MDFSSAFNTIHPALLDDKLRQLNVPDSLSRWIKDFLTGWSQRVRLGTTVSDTRTLNIGSPQGCVLSPWLFSLYTNCCTSSHESVKLIKFADDTTLIGLITDGDESAYRREVDRLVSWCSNNNLEPNAQKTVEIVVDFRRGTAPPSRLSSFAAAYRNIVLSEPSSKMALCGYGSVVRTKEHFDNLERDSGGICWPVDVQHLIC